MLVIDIKNKALAKIMPTRLSVNFWTYLTKNKFKLGGLFMRSYL